MNAQKISIKSVLINAYQEPNFTLYNKNNYASPNTYILYKFPFYLRSFLCDIALFNLLKLELVSINNFRIMEQPNPSLTLNKLKKTTKNPPNRLPTYTMCICNGEFQFKFQM